MGVYLCNTSYCPIPLCHKIEFKMKWHVCQQKSNICLF